MKKYTHNQERGWELERRVKCHGHKGSCAKAHLAKKLRVFSESVPTNIKINKQSWWTRLLKFLRII